MPELLDVEAQRLLLSSLPEWSLTGFRRRRKLEPLEETDTDAHLRVRLRYLPDPLPEAPVHELRGRYALPGLRQALQAGHLRVRRRVQRLQRRVPVSNKQGLCLLRRW